jgi:ABC-type sugar transport system permease subunit
MMTRFASNPLLQTRRFSLKPFFYLLPAFLVIGFIYLYPVVEVCRFSLLDFLKTPRQFVGFRNYGLVFQDERFYQSLFHNILLLLNVPIMTMIALLLAVVINDHVHGWKVYRSLVLTPYVIPIVAIGFAMSNFFSLNGGFNQILAMVGLGFIRKQWIVDPSWALPTIAAVIIWRQTGFGVILFLARLSSMSEEIIEAARIDGAGWWRRFRKIIIPELGTVIEFFVTLNIIVMLSQIFAFVFVMTNGGPGYKTWITEFYIYKEAFHYNRMGHATVAAVILLIITVIFIIISYRYREKLAEEY